MPSANSPSQLTNMMAQASSSSASTTQVRPHLATSPPPQPSLAFDRLRSPSLAFPAVSRLLSHAPHLPLQPHPVGGAISSLSIDESGRRLLTGATDGILRLWNYSSGQVRYLPISPTSPDLPSPQISISPDLPSPHLAHLPRPSLTLSLAWRSPVELLVRPAAV